MAYLIGSKALEIVGRVSSPPLDYDMIVDKNELSAIVNFIEFSDYRLQQHPPYHEKFTLYTNDYTGELTIMTYPSHFYAVDNIAHLCSDTFIISGMNFDVASLSTLWLYKRAPVTFPINKRKTLDGLLEISRQLFGMNPANYSLFNPSQLELFSLLKNETRSRVSPEDRSQPEPEDADEFFKLPVDQRIRIVQEQTGDLDLLCSLLENLTDTRVADFILDHIAMIIPESN